MKRHYATTFLSEAVVIASYLICFRLVARQAGPTGFAEYALSRRALGLLIPLGVLGLDLAIIRVMTSHGRQTFDPATLTAAAVIAAGQLCLIGVVILTFRSAASRLFYGDQTYTSLAATLPLLLLGVAIGGIATATLRAQLRIQRANLMYALTNGAVPVVAVAVGGRSVPSILALLAAGWIVIPPLFLVPIQLTFADVVPRGRELLRYGMPRVPGDLAQLALFAAPGVVVAHTDDIRAAGLVAFGVSLVGFVGSALAPVSFVFFPEALHLISAGSLADVRRKAATLSVVVTIAVALGVLVTEVAAEPLIRFYLGTGFTGRAGAIRLTVLAAIPWSLYLTLRSVIDAAHLRALNARNMVISTAGYPIFVLLASRATSVQDASEIGFVTCLCLLATLTIIIFLQTTSRWRLSDAPVASPDVSRDPP